MAERELDVERIAYEVVGEVAPDELDYFPVAASEFRGRPDRRPRRSDGDDELGFGVDLGFAMSPLVLWVTQEALKFLAAQLRPAMVHAAAPLSRRLLVRARRIPILRRLLRSRRRPGFTLLRQLTDHELAQMRSICLDRARAAGVEPGTADLLADAIVGRVALLG